MKNLISCIVLLSWAQYAYGDMTLEFKEIISKGFITYSIKNEHLKFTQSEQSRINLFNQKNQQFISFDPQSGKSALFDEKILELRVNQLNEKRLEKLAKVESNLKKKLQTMSPDEQEVGESLVNLLKYPEMYGEHTHLNVKKLDTLKQIQNIPCQVYQLYRAKKRIKDFCMAEAKDLKMPARDYQTYRGFYAFNYDMQTRLMIAMGNTRFNLVNYKQQKIPGIAIESINYRGSKVTQHLILNQVNTHTLAKTEFTLPQSTTTD